MARNPTPDQIVKNWTGAMQSSATQQKYKDGVSRYNGNPMAQAASPEATQRYLNRVQESVASGKRQNRLNATPADRWKQNSVNIGAAAMSTGAQKGKAKVMEAAQKWAPIYAQASAEVAAMPKGGRAEAKARAARAIDILMDAAGRM
jgi:hypothetical protein